MYGERLFRRPKKKTILGGDFRFLAVPLSEMDLDNANTRGMLVFFLKTM